MEYTVIDVSDVKEGKLFGDIQDFYFITLDVEGREIVLQCVRGDVYSAFASFERFRDKYGIIQDVRPTDLSAQVLRAINEAKAAGCAA